MLRKMKAGETSQSIPIFVQDSSSSTGAGLGSLVFNTAGLAAKYLRRVKCCLQRNCPQIEMLSFANASRREARRMLFCRPLRSGSAKSTQFVSNPQARRGR